MSGLFCIGGVCVPTNAVIPIVILVFRQIYLTLIRWYKKANGTFDESEMSSDEGLETKVSARRGKRGKSDDASTAPSETMETEEQFRKALAEHDFVVVKFTAAWCEPCKKIEPFFASLGRKHGGDSRFSSSFVQVDVDDLDNIAMENKVSMMPTFVVFKKGNKLGSYSGSDKHQLERFVTESLVL